MPENGLANDRIPLHRDMYFNYFSILQQARWPSGLRRHVKAVVSSEARVRTPLSSKLFAEFWKSDIYVFFE